MKTRYRLGGRRLQSTSIVALAIGAGFAALATGPAHAAGTLAGTLVSNTVTVDYSVGNVEQTAEAPPEPATFYVDRMIDVQVAGTGDTVVPGEDETTATLVFTVQNQGNFTETFDIDAIEFSDGLGSGLVESTDATIEIGEYGLFLDNNNDGVLDAGDTWLDPADLTDVTLTPDQTVKILLVAHIPLDADNLDSATYDLLAVAVDGTGTALVEETAPTLAGTDIVFVDAETAGNLTTDIAEDGEHSDDATFTVDAADLTVAKSVKVIDRDPAVDCATAPQDGDATELFAIPGACIEYTITVTNPSGGADAADVAISDLLPSEVTFVAFHTSSSGAFTTLSSGDVAPCHATGCTPAEADGQIKATEALVASGTTLNLVIRATVN